MCSNEWKLVTDMLKNRKFEKYILINRIWGVMISLAMVAVMVVMASRFELISRLGSRSYRTFAEIATGTDAVNEDVNITVTRADYAGYDYYVDSELQARYYYAEEDGSFAILLIDSDEDVILNYNLRGRVIPSDENFDVILSGLSDEMGIEEAQLSSETYDMVVSEIDFPRIYYNMMFLVLVLAIVWAVYMLADCLYIVTHPWKHSGVAAALGRKADRRTVLDIDDQLRYHIYFEQDGIVITDKYFVCHGLFRTDVVALSSIVRYKKLRTTSNVNTNKRVYKLLMTDVEGVTYEQNFKTEALLDEALSYLEPPVE